MYFQIWSMQHLMNTNQKYTHTTSAVHSKSNLANKGHTTHKRTQIGREGKKKKWKAAQCSAWQKTLMIGSLAVSVLFQLKSADIDGSLWQDKWERNRERYNTSSAGEGIGENYRYNSSSSRSTMMMVMTTTTATTATTTIEQRFCLLVLKSFQPQP